MWWYIEVCNTSTIHQQLLAGNLCQETEISTHYHLTQTVSLQTTATLHVHGNAYTYTMCTSINDIYY